MKCTGFRLLLITAALAQIAAPQSHPIPPGVRQADQAETQNEKNIPPPAISETKIDLAKQSREAEELSRLSQSIPSDVANVGKGTLPKDLVQKLKRIEKLAKNLRAELISTSSK